MNQTVNKALFGDSRFFTLPSGADFLGVLSRSILDVTGARSRPEALSDALIFVPNRRSARALAGKLFAELGGNAFLPPDIRPLGDAGDNDPALLGELADVDVRPSMPTGTRIGALTLLVSQWYAREEHPVTLASAMSVARKLAALLDQAALAGNVDWSELEGLVDQAELAEHWQSSVRFLDIIAQQWPLFLDEKGFSDSAEKDQLAAQALCRRWERATPDTPVFVVGSTGSSPATRMIMAGAARLPRGCVLFPGLDTELDEATWSAVLHSPSHPQNAFAETLAALDVPYRNVRIWPGYAENAAQVARRKLIQESLAPADATADWVRRLEDRAAPLSRQEMTEQGMAGLSLIEAETEAAEADAIALLLRETLETEGKTAALVTPDAGLARRVSTQLARWGVKLEPSSGTPLLRTQAGSFVMRVLDFVLDSGDPVALAALLKHVKMELGENAHLVSLTERGFLRGLKRWDGLSGLMAWSEQAMENAQKHPKRAPIDSELYAEAQAILVDLEDRAGPLLDEFGAMFTEPFELRPFVEKLAELADLLSKSKDDDGPSMLWSGEDGAAAARFLEELAGMDEFLPPVMKEDLHPLFEGFAENRNVPPERPGHPTLSILGPLEARLQSCDLVILGGLNEGVWPEPPSVDGFLPRHFRSKIGLPDTEARIGLSAHDFAQLACSPNVVLTRSERVDNKPSVASRWLWRLRILASGALGSLEETDRRLKAEQAHVLDWVAAQHKGAGPVDVPSPRPCPPLDARPRNMNVTDVTKLIRDPYGYYARNILGLRKLDALNEKLGAREIGTAMHKALEHKDTRKDPSVTPDSLITAFGTELERVGGDTLFFIEREGRWRNAAQTYHAWMQGRDNQVTERYFETDYSHELEIASGIVKLRGRADLVETLADGSVAITDHKTGRPPSASQVAAGLEPQLPLLAIIAEKGHSKNGPKGTASELLYFALGSDPGAKDVTGKGDMTVPKLMDEAEAGFRRLMEQYLQPGQPYLSSPRVQFSTQHNDYDRLARRKEWADAGAEAGDDA